MPFLSPPFGPEPESSEYILFLLALEDGGSSPP